jgi:diaminohydroxyphosphoribosylaminopyrimidine deaminase/5-amino-6-(5-phosphoribosylamino)uracil reductase
MNLPKESWSKTDYQMMALALRLAQRGEYTARPNPMVGCVLVKNGSVVGKGWHKKSGEAHAEVNALIEAGEKAEGATCYVTLEPCSHVGKTGACAEALIKSGVTEVIAAINDPNPQVSGNGFQRLEQAGIKVSVGLLRDQAELINQGFFAKFTQRKPKVTVKLAMSMDGRTALADGKSQWITGSAARMDVQRLRAKQDAIITGIGTQMNDNPSMTCRSDGDSKWFSSLYKFEQPRRILLDSSAKAELTDKFFLDDPLDAAANSVWWVNDSPAAKEKLKQTNRPNVKLVEKKSIQHLLTQCADEGFNQVLVESGHQLAGAFLAENLVDEIIVYMAPKLMGTDAMGLFDISVATMQDCPALRLTNVRQLGDDIRLTYQPIRTK